MIVWMILIAVFLLIFVVPYGVDASYESGVIRLGVKVGFIRIWLLPKKPKTEKKLAKEEKKKAKKAAREAKKAADKAEKQRNQTLKVKAKKPMDLPFVYALVKMGIRAVKRVFRSFTVDRLKLYYVVATNDPYDTAIQYSYLCAALAALPEIAGDVIHIRKPDVQVGMDFTREKPIISGRIVISLQLYKIVCVALAFAVEFIRWKNTHRQTDVMANERTEENGREQDQRIDGCNNEQDQTAC